MKNLFMGLITNLIGALIIFLIFTLFLNSKEKKENEKRRKTIIKQLNPYITEYIQILYLIYKSASNTMPPKKEPYSKQLGEDFYKQLKYFDIYSNSHVVNQNGPWKWLEWLIFRFTYLNKELDEFIKKYGFFIDIKLLDSILLIKESKISERFEIISWGYIPRETYNTVFISNVKDSFEKLIEGLQKYENILSSEKDETLKIKKIWIHIPVGSSRLSEY